jgi:hypothetical protein
VTGSQSTELFAATRDGWHRVAEHVLAAAQYAQTGKISLRPVAGGFRTTRPLRDNARLSVVRTQLVVDDDAGVRTAPLTTVAAAAQFVGAEPGMAATVYQPATPLEPDAPLTLDAGCAQVLADWYALADAALLRLTTELGTPPQQPILWPEHFDVGITIGTVNYGASPGDDGLADPYLYVGPHGGPPVRDAYWNAAFGATRAMQQVASVDEAVAFFRTGFARLTDLSMPT